MKSNLKTIVFVVGNTPMHKFFAQRLKDWFPKLNIKIIIEETFSISNSFKQLRYRLKKYGFLKVINEISYKLYESKVQRLLPEYGKKFKLHENIEHEYVSENINNVETESIIKTFKPDLLIVYGSSLIEKKIFSIPKLGTLNIHLGINPKYRGAGSFWAIKNQDFKYYGFTIHLVDEGIDTGCVICSRLVDFNRFEMNLLNMKARFTLLAIESISEVINKIIQTGMLQKEEPLTKESKFYSFVGISDYISMRWKNRHV